MRASFEDILQEKFWAESRASFLPFFKGILQNGVVFLMVNWWLNRGGMCGECGGLGALK